MDDVTPTPPVPALSASEAAPAASAPVAQPTPPPTPMAAPPDAGSPAPAAPAAHWAENLPEGLKEQFKGMDEAKAAEALQRGLGYEPVTNAEAIKFTLPEGLAEDAAMSAGFKEFMVQNKLTAAQGQKALDWYISAQQKSMEAAVATGMAELKGRWGVDETTNRTKALNGFVALDKMMDGRFSQSQAGKAFANSPEAVEAFYHIAKLMSEDTLGAAAATSGGATAKTAQEFYSGLFPNN